MRNVATRYRLEHRENTSFIIMSSVRRQLSICAVARLAEKLDNKSGGGGRIVDQNSRPLLRVTAPAFFSQPLFFANIIC